MATVTEITMAIKCLQDFLVNMLRFLEYTNQSRKENMVLNKWKISRLPILLFPEFTEFTAPLKPWLLLQTCRNFCYTNLFLNSSNLATRHPPLGQFILQLSYKYLKI